MEYSKLFDLGHPTFYMMTIDERSFDIIYLQLALIRKKGVIRMLRGYKSTTTSDFFNEAAAALQFPYYFGENWAAFDECIVDLSWLEGDAYLLMIRNANLLLCTDYDGEVFKILTRIFSDASKEWLTPNKDDPNRLLPIPFHVLLQCENSLGSSALSQRLLDAGVEFEIFIPPDPLYPQIPKEKSSN